MTNPLSRRGFNHPVQGAPGDATLYSNIEAIYQAIGDDSPFRWFTSASVTNGSTVTLTHTLRCAFSELTFRFYTYTGTFTPTTTELTRQAQGASGVSVIANVTNPTTQVDITNNTGGTISIATLICQARFAEKLSDLPDVDTTGAQDGQALVYVASASKFEPGASGDASFKLQSVSTPNLVIKGGYLLDPASGAEYATYSGSGSVAASYGVDETLNLSTILGSSPANATLYQLCIDRTTLSAASVLTDNSRSLISVVQANYALLTGTLAAVDKDRYLPLGFIKSATTGTAWSGSGSAFGTYAVRVIAPTIGLAYNKFVHPTIVAPNFYATLAAAFAAASAGDRILVLGGYTITTAETLSLSNVTVKFLPNVVITINAAVKGLIISGNDNIVEDAKYISAFSGTIPAGIEVSGLRNTVDRAKVESNAGGTTITAAFNLASGADKTDIRGLFQQTAGTISNAVTDNSGNSNNQFVVR